MGKFWKFITGRLLWSAILISVQVGLLVYAIFLGSVKYALLSQIFMAITWIMTMIVVGKDENPAYKIGWMLIFMLFPLYGGFLYLLIGNKKFTSRISRKWDQTATLYREGMADVSSDNLTVDEDDPMLARQQSYITKVSGFPALDGTEAKFYAVGEDWFDDMMEEISHAKRFILMEFFIIDEGEVWDSVLAILKRKVDEGVDVRLVYDDVGTIKFLPQSYPDKLRAMGLKVALFNPLKPHINSRMNCRDHRKVLVVDGNVGFSGGVNLADEYVNRKLLYGHWKDYAIRLEGKAVGNLTLMFMQIWVWCTHEALDFSYFMPKGAMRGKGFVQPFGDNPMDDRNVAESAYQQIISTATRYVWITTPYLVLDNELVSSLRVAACSGVDVRIVVPHIPDKWYVFAVTRSYYRELAYWGVKVYEYLPGFIHAKTIVSDDKVAILGTINMDYRTFYLNFENGIAFYHAPVVGEVAEDVQKVCTLSHLVTMDEVNRTPLWRRIGRQLLRLFAPLM